MMEYEAAMQRMREIREGVERTRRAVQARRAMGGGRTVRLAVGTGLARLGLRVAGPAAVRAALGDAR